MDALVGEGVTSFKMFMAYPGVFYATDDEILRAMQRAAGNGATIMMHAENGIAIDELVGQALAAGHDRPGLARPTRPPELEGEATSRAIRLAQVAGAPLYIVHLSATQALDAVTAARDRGATVFAETCPQYLYLSQDDLDKPGFEGAKYVCLTAAAAQASTRQHSGAACAATTCPWSPPTTARSASRTRRSSAAATSPRSRTASRASSTGSTCCTRAWPTASCPRPAGSSSTRPRPARMFGLYPRKGTIAPGSDADIVLYDPHRQARRCPRPRTI